MKKMKSIMTQIYVPKKARDHLSEFCTASGFRMQKAAELAIIEWLNRHSTEEEPKNATSKS